MAPEPAARPASPALDGRLDLGRFPTPMQAFAAWPNAYLKRDDLSEPEIGGSKLRRAAYVLNEALRQGATDIITAGLAGSNQVRMLAVLGARLGLGVHAFVPADAAETDAGFRFARDRGAQLTGLDPNGWVMCAARIDRLCRRLAKDGRRPFAISLGLTEPAGMLAGHALMTEIDAQVSGTAPLTIFVPSGEGATVFGLTAALHTEPAFTARRPVRLVALSIQAGAATLRERLLRHAVAFAAAYGAEIDVDAGIAIDDGCARPDYNVVTDDTRRLQAELADTTGVSFDPVYVARPFHRFCERLAGAEPGDAVFVVTGGGKDSGAQS